MKFIALILLTCGLNADPIISVNGQPTFLMPSAAIGVFQSTDTVTYALNRVTPTVRSAVIDTAGWVGVGIQLTSSAGAAISMEWAPANTAALFKRSYLLQSEGPANFVVQQRYLRFTSVLMPNGLTYTTASLAYLPIVAPPTTVSGTVTVAGTVTANQGTPGSQAWPVRITTTTTVDANGSSVTAYQGGGYWGVSVTALPAYVGVSDTAYTVTTHTASTVALSHCASTNAKVDISVYGNFGGSGFRWKITNSSTPPSDLAQRGNYQATTATTQIKGFYDLATENSWHFHAIGVGSSSTDVGISADRRGTNNVNP